MELQVVTLVPQDKKKIRVILDNGESFLLYRGEIRSFSLVEGVFIQEDVYNQILELLKKRAIRRAMHILERQERTEKQLREKLQKSEYPPCCIEAAITYVKSYHYIDDYRYATVYVRYHQEKESRQKLTMKLMQRGISKDVIEQALAEEYQAEEEEQIIAWLKKKHYNPAEADANAYRKMAQFLLRKGFKSRDIFRVLGQDDLYNML